MPDELIAQADSTEENLAELYSIEKEEFYQAFLRARPSFSQMFLDLTDENKALLEATIKEVYQFSQE